MSYSNHEKTFNIAVDMVAECVGHYRHFMKPIKTVYLRPRYYAMFRSWLQYQMKDSFNPDQMYQFDGVNIEEASNLQLQMIRVDFYEKDIIVN